MDSKELAEAIAAHAHGKVPRELRRQQVLAEAHDLFVERGYEGTSMDELARRVGVSKPVIYGLAGSKEQLFKDVIGVASQELADAVDTAVAAADDVVGKLRAGILAFLRFVEQRRAAWGALLVTDAGPASQELLALRRQQALRVAASLPLGEKGDPRVAEAVAHAIDGACELAALWWERHPEVSAEALADLLTNLFLPGLTGLALGSTSGLLDGGRGEGQANWESP